MHHCWVCFTPLFYFGCSFCKEVGSSFLQACNAIFTLVGAYNLYMPWSLAVVSSFNITFPLQSSFTCDGICPNPNPYQTQKKFMSCCSQIIRYFHHPYLMANFLIAIADSHSFAPSFCRLCIEGILLWNTNLQLVWGACATLRFHWNTLPHIEKSQNRFIGVNRSQLKCSEYLVLEY